jgi:hypothetical protein
LITSVQCDFEIRYHMHLRSILFGQNVFSQIIILYPESSRFLINWQFQVLFQKDCYHICSVCWPLLSRKTPVTYYMCFISQILNSLKKYNTIALQHIYHFWSKKNNKKIYLQKAVRTRNFSNHNNVFVYAY